MKITKLLFIGLIALSLSACTLPSLPKSASISAPMDNTSIITPSPDGSLSTLQSDLQKIEDDGGKTELDQLDQEIQKL